MLGLPAGLIWSAVAPRAVVQLIVAGFPAAVNAETSAYIAADGWFCAIAAVAGILTGVIGYLLLVKPGENTFAAVGLVLGSLAAAFIMWWLGGQIGLSAYQHAVATSRIGADFNQSLNLGAKSAIAFWPLLTAVTIGLFELGARRTENPNPDAPLARY